MTDLRYPIGKFQQADKISVELHKELIQQIAEAPARLREAVKGLSEEQLGTPYRPGGWTVRQVVHHLPDSHLNAYVRFKLALTETVPLIRPYDEGLWADVHDARLAPVEISLVMLDSLHQRWVFCLQSMEVRDFSRKFRHPEHGLMDIGKLVALYAWHGRHHVAHITSLRERMGWQ